MVSRGFLFVASVVEKYARSAYMAASTIKDYYPSAHITLAVSPSLAKTSWVDPTVFDHIIYNAPEHSRAKLWALSRTPYTELTAYVDADMECWHSDVQKIWNEVPPESDIHMTRIRPYSGKISKWPKGEMIWHCGFFVYRTNPHTLAFMQRWWEEYVFQRANPWPYKEDDYPIALKEWDQFAFWKLLSVNNLSDKPITVTRFNDDARWNFVNNYRPSETSSPIIFFHHTLPNENRSIT